MSKAYYICNSVNVPLSILLVVFFFIYNGSKYNVTMVDAKWINIDIISAQTSIFTAGDKAKSKIRNKFGNNFLISSHITKYNNEILENHEY